MKNLTVITVLILILGAFAAAMGLFWQTDGQPYEVQSLRGETVTMYGKGLYRYDTLLAASQAVGQDAVTLFISVPLLAVSLWLARRGLMRGKLLLTGTFGYFLYTYAAMSFMSAYNELFLVYVALFSLSLFGFTLSMLGFDAAQLPEHFGVKFPRKGLIALALVMGTFLLLAWLGRIIPPLLQGTPPYGLENYTTLVIQVLDLGVIVPVCLLTGILLWQKKSSGYLLGAVVTMKGLTFGLALVAMIINMALNKVEINLVEAAIFITLVATMLFVAVRVLQSAVEEPALK
jgi:hypothetical protein